MVRRFLVLMFFVLPFLSFGAETVILKGISEIEGGAVLEFSGRLPSSSVSLQMGDGGVSLSLRGIGASPELGERLFSGKNLFRKAIVSSTGSGTTVLLSLRDRIPGRVGLSLEGRFLKVICDGVSPGWSSPSVGFPMVRAVLGVALVLSFLFISVWVFKRFVTSKRHAGSSGGSIRFLDVHHVSSKHKIAAFDVGGDLLVVGITENGMVPLMRRKSKVDFRKEMESYERESERDLNELVVSLKEKMMGLRKV